MKKILILEGTPMYQRKISEILQTTEIPMEILIVEDVDSAIDIVKQKSFDLLILQGKASRGYGTDVLIHLSESQKKKVILNSFDPYFSEFGIKNNIFYLKRRNDKDELISLVKQIIFS